MGKGIWLITLLLAVLLVLPAACLAEKQELKYVDLETLKGMLGDPQLLLLDVRAPGDWAKAHTKIQGAVRQEPGEVAAWGATLPKDKKIVLYCA